MNREQYIDITITSVGRNLGEEYEWSEYQVHHSYVPGGICTIFSYILGMSL